jgi:hypothetical protein
MSAGNILGGEFQSFRQEQEGLIDRVRGSLGVDYGLTTLSGSATVACGVKAVDQIHQGYLVGAVALVVLSLANAAYVFYGGRRIVGRHKQIKVVKEELERIRENPKYNGVEDLVE